jgi:hypothetical protein
MFLCFTLLPFPTFPPKKTQTSKNAHVICGVKYKGICPIKFYAKLNDMTTRS